MSKQQPITVTREGLQALENELAERKGKIRNEILEAIRTARGFGDLSENSEYDEAKDAQAKNESKILELEEKIKLAVVIEETAANSNRVTLGKAVKVKNEENGKETVYYIVGSTETDPFAHRISDQSPIGMALINSIVGDTVTANTPKGAVRLIVLDITEA